MTTARAAFVALIAVVATMTIADQAGAAPRPPIGLRVSEGDHWRPRSDFELRWTNPEASPQIAAVRYLVRDPLGGAPAGPQRVGQAVEHLRLHLTSPGAHTIEVWLEDTAGAQGAPAEATLRFDPQRPGASSPAQPTGWLSRTEIPHPIRLSHPQGPIPVSGIRGYAVAVDRRADGSPCAAEDLCTDAETDLRGGADGDTLVVEELPEGVSHVHSVAVSGSGMRSATVGHAMLRVDKVDPVTRLEGVPAGWTNRSVSLTATATDSASAMGGGAFTAIRIDDGAPVVSAGPSARATVIEAGVHTVAHYARDAAGNLNDGGRSNGQANHQPSTAKVRIDREPPLVAFVGARYPGDPELIEARVSDPLSGAAPDRGRIAVRAVSSGDPFEPLPTVVGPGFLRARWSSDEYPPGVYEFRATGFDAAGNAGASTTRANGSGMLLPNPLKARTELRAGIGSGAGGRALRLVSFGRATTLSGRLTGASDAPLDELPVRVVERFDPGTTPAVRATTVLTGEAGRFAVRLEPGPSREVVAVFDGNRRATRATSARLRLAVRSSVTLESSASSARVGGRPVVFSGAVAADAGAIPAGGATVQLQFRVPGLPWTEFRTTRTDRRGRFRHPYRFSDDDSRGVRFEFRAFVPAQSGWPYEPGGSRPVAVRGL